MPARPRLHEKGTAVDSHDAGASAKASDVTDKSFSRLRRVDGRLADDDPAKPSDKSGTASEDTLRLTGLRRALEDALLENHELRAISEALGKRYRQVVD